MDNLLTVLEIPGVEDPSWRSDLIKEEPGAWWGHPRLALYIVSNYRIGYNGVFNEATMVTMALLHEDFLRDKVPLWEARRQDGYALETDVRRLARRLGATEEKLRHRYMTSFRGSEDGVKALQALKEANPGAVDFKRDDHDDTDIYLHPDMAHKYLDFLLDRTPKPPAQQSPLEVFYHDVAGTHRDCELLCAGMPMYVDRPLHLTDLGKWDLLTYDIYAHKPDCVPKELHDRIVRVHREFENLARVPGSNLAPLGVYSPPPMIEAPNEDEGMA